MKNSLAAIVFVLSFQVIVNAQSGWFWQNPLPTGSNLWSVYFVNELTGWAVGGYGTILRTTDGGTTWTSQVCRHGIHRRTAPTCEP